MSRQQNLFEDAADLKWQRADAQDWVVAQIVFNRPMEMAYSYLVPDSFRGLLKPGQRVKAPFGRSDRLTSGFCVGIEQGGPDHPLAGKKLKPIAEVLDLEPLANAQMLELTKWIADYYLCSWGQVLHGVIPAAVKNNAGTREIRFFQLADDLPEDLDALALPSKQRSVVDVLQQAAKPLPIDELTAAAECGTSPVNTLVKKGVLVAIREKRLTYTPDEREVQRQEDLTLSPQQQQALDTIVAAIEQKRTAAPPPRRDEAASVLPADPMPEPLRTLLLHGVTGSGKTEIYIRAIRHAVEFGRQAIVLVPEISLTPQTIRRFRRRFDTVAVLHSHLTDAERHFHWQRIAAGEVQVIVGARSAVFAPCPRLGLIVIDEEHENTFKQETTPRYHAREVARKRAEMERIPLVLGTATPTLETWWNAHKRNYQLISMPERIEKLPMPPVVTVDTLNDPMIRRGHNIGRALQTAVDQTLRDNGQVILFFNLRGFTPVLFCRKCGEKLSCPHCATSLTWHKDKKLCLCHTCDYTIPLPSVCPSCSQPGLRHFGSGTQRLEEEIRQKFPGVSVLRMDSDSMRKPGSHDEALERFRQGEVSILLGTQMIAKGLDFPNVTLVGVVDADTALHQIDFRASERTFQLISQVAGRTGRSSRGGRVLVQTMQPDAESIKFAAGHDYVGFARCEMGHRRERLMPPYSALLRLILRGTDEKLLEEASLEFGDILREASDAMEEKFRVLGPAPAPLARHKDYYRFQIMVTSPTHPALRKLYRDCLPKLNKISGIEFAVDVDPLHLR